MEILAPLQSRKYSFDSQIKGLLSTVPIMFNSAIAKQDASPNPSREQLIDAVQRHFMSQVDKQI